MKRLIKLLYLNLLLSVSMSSWVHANSCPRVSGLWFDPTLSGEGYNLLQMDSGFIVTYYGYSQNNERLWLISDVHTEDIEIDQPFSLTLSEGIGGNFQSPVAPVNLTDWGTIDIVFDSATTGQFTLNGQDGQKQAQVVLLAGVQGDQCHVETCQIPLVSRQQISFISQSEIGIFDPNLAANPHDNSVWMSYSEVTGSTLWPEQNFHVVSTKLAVSNNQGEEWLEVDALNPAVDVTVQLTAPLNAGTWVSEVSSLVYDKGANAQEKWKLIWHHYLQINGDRRFEHGWFGFKSAASPQELVTAEEIKLFSGFGYDSVNNTANGLTQTPVAGTPKIMLALLHDDLATCIIATEPGLYSTESVLYLSFTCIEVNPTNSRIVLLSCDQPCDVTQLQSWRYVKTLLNNNDAISLGFEKFSAPDVFESNGETYLWVTPVNSSPFDEAYNGCLGYRFSDLTTGSLISDEQNLPQQVLQLSGLENTFYGACAYHQAATKAGVIIGEVFPAQTEVFRMFKTETINCNHLNKTK
ncbi:MAG: hypothetical protein JKY19_00885 [Alcanivoracaceae bacterium]|nr:hypothetical protein [Alcanivoracaceae bacterium]